jgi:DNA-binding response OmpR family regulator
MAVSARVLETGGELLRAVIPDQPVLLVGPPSFWEVIGASAWLEAHGWACATAADADRARWLASIQKISLVLVSGDDRFYWSALEATRPVTMAPVVIVGNPPPSQVVALVGAGADAVVDPKSGPDEMFARVTAVLRRSDHGWEPGVRYLRADALRIDLWAHKCDLGGQPLHLSPTEYALLTFLMRHPLQALTTQTIVREVWRWIASDGKNALRILVNRLRRKLGDDTRQPRYIESVRGTGYRFIRSVIEMGDDAPLQPDRPDVAPLLQSVEDLALALQGSRESVAAATVLLDALDDTGYADAMALFQIDGRKMRLMAAKHMPPRWLTMVEPGVPLKRTFASAQSVLSREPVQFADVRLMSQSFSSTVDHLAGAGFRACMFLPIVCGERVWGHLGLVRQSRQPFDPVGTAYLRTACAVFGLSVTA